MNTNSNKWFYWGRWNQVMLFTSPWGEFPNTKIFKRMGLNFFKKAIKVLNGDYYFLKDDHNKLCELVVSKIESDQKWFNKFFSICEEKTKKVLKLENRDDLKRFIQEMVDFLGCSTLVEFIDICIERYLQELCSKKGVEFSFITSNIRFPRKTELTKYKDELKKLKRNKNKINEFVKKFEWVGTHAFEGKKLTKQRVLEELKLLEENYKERKRNIAPEFKDIIRIASKLAYYRSNLMEVIDRVSYSYWDKLKKLGKKHNLSFFDVISLTHNEIAELIEKSIVPKYLSKRKKKFGLVLIDNKVDILLGKQLEKELEIHKTQEDYNVKEIKGVIAYKGVVKGKTKIVREVEEISKVKKGDILVAHETTPDFITAMSKAAAFVTDIGGLTCHAAIMSREMNKPCIIGTKIATKVLKDGDLVEVDAEKGIVKIIK